MALKTNGLPVRFRLAMNRANDRHSQIASVAIAAIAANTQANTTICAAAATSANTTNTVMLALASMAASPQLIDPSGCSSDDGQAVAPVQPVLFDYTGTQRKTQRALPPKGVWIEEVDEPAAVPGTPAESPPRAGVSPQPREPRTHQRKSRARVKGTEAQGSGGSRTRSRPPNLTRSEPRTRSPYTVADRM